MMTGKRKAPDDEVLSRASTVTRDAPREARGSSKSTKLQQRRGEAARSSQTDDVYYRNLYTVEPDFRQLAQQDAEFAAMYVRWASSIPYISLTFIHSASSRTDS